MRAAGQRIDLRIDVAVGDKQIQPAIVVKIGESRSPAHIRDRWNRDASSVRNIFEVVVAVVAVEGVVFVGEVGDKNAGISGVQIIAHCDSHASLLRAIAIHCCARWHADIGKS